MKRPDPVKNPSKGKVVCVDAAFAKRFPTIMAMMCDAWWDDGKSRECSTLTVRMGPDECVVSLSDHATQASAYTSAQSLESALALMEDALREGKLPFRPWKSGKR